MTLRIALGSDIHLEFGNFDPRNEHNADVLVLAGDILVAEDLPKNTASGARFRTFLLQCSQRFPHVVYIPGNHEFYHGKFFKTLTILREQTAQYPNVHFLEGETVTINDTLFIGATLWTDCNKGDPLTMHALSDMMMDYKLIRNDNAGYTKLRPAHTIQRHMNTLNYIHEVIANYREQKQTGKVVMVGHHAPSQLSTPPRFRHDFTMNGGYNSDLSELILDHPEIVLWVHGHTHDPFDYEIGDTRIVCNPRGYIGHEAMADEFELKIIDI